MMMQRNRMRRERTGSERALEDWSKRKREEEDWAFKESKRVQKSLVRRMKGAGDKMDLIIREIREMRTEGRKDRERLKGS